MACFVPSISVSHGSYRNMYTHTRYPYETEVTLHMPHFPLHLVTHSSARKNPRRELHVKLADRKPKTQKGENSLPQLAPLHKLDLAPPCEPPHQQSAKHKTSSVLDTWLVFWNTFSHNWDLFPRKIFDRADLVLASLPELPDFSCHPRICWVFFSSLKSYRSSQKTEWGLGGH